MWCDKPSAKLTCKGWLICIMPKRVSLHLVRQLVRLLLQEGFPLKGYITSQNKDACRGTQCLCCHQSRCPVHSFLVGIRHTQRSRRLLLLVAATHSKQGICPTGSPIMRHKAFVPPRSCYSQQAGHLSHPVASHATQGVCSSGSREEGQDGTYSRHRGNACCSLRSPKGSSPEDHCTPAPQPPKPPRFISPSP